MIYVLKSTPFYTPFVALQVFCNRTRLDFPLMATCTHIISSGHLAVWIDIGDNKPGMGNQHHTEIS